MYYYDYSYGLPKNGTGPVQKQLVRVEIVLAQNSYECEHSLRRCGRNALWVGRQSCMEEERLRRLTL